MDVQQEGNLEPRCPKRGQGQTSAGRPKRERGVFSIFSVQGGVWVFLGMIQGV